MEGELLGGKGWGQGAKPTHPWPLKSGEGRAPGSRLATTLVSSLCGFPRPPSLACPRSWGGDWGGATGGGGKGS